MASHYQLFLWCENLCTSFWNILVIGQLDQVDDRGRHESVGIASKIENLDQFGSLRTRIMFELSAKPNMTVQTLLANLTGLPLSLRKEYESSIAKRMRRMRTETQVNELFIHLNPLTSFIDYGLIEYVIKNFGSEGLKKDMRSYYSEIIVFMKETTIKQLIGHLPGQTEIPPKFSLIEAKIGQNASECTLEQLNTIRKRYCSEVKLSEIVFHLVAIVESNSFIVRWLVPSALVSDVVRSTKNVNQSFYREYKITSLTLDGMWLFMSESEIDIMWSRLHVSDTKFKVQFHAMYKQIVYELEMAQIARHQLSSFFEKSLKCHQSASYSLGHELLNHKLPVSIVDFRVLAAAIEGFGSNCLKSVMSSYSKYMSTILKKPTAQQLINLSATQLQPSGYSIVKCRIKEEPSHYKLDKLFEFQTEFCTIADLSELRFIMDEINTDSEMSGTFTVNWLVPSAFVSKIMKFGKKVNHNLCHRFNITSLTLDGMWLYMCESEIDAMWSRLHVSDTEFKDQFNTMCKQIVCEMKMQNVSKDRLLSYFQSVNYQQQMSNHLSLAVLEEEFPASFVDFRVLKAVIGEFGNDCLKRVMGSYCNYMSSIFTKKSTAQQLINIGDTGTMSTMHAQSTDFKHFKIAQCKIMEEPSNYKLEILLSFQAKFCTTANCGEVCFIMTEVNTEAEDSFTVNWLVPLTVIADIIMKSVRNLRQSFYQEYKITSLTLDGMWLFLSEFEIDAMWSQVHVNNTEFKDQFCTMCKQIVCEMNEVKNVSRDGLSSYLQSLDYQRQISDQLSLAVLEKEFPASFVDFGVLKAVIEKFGSDILRRVMRSYCNYVSSIFTKESTAQQLVIIGNMTTIQSTGSKYFKIAQCKIMEEPSNYKLETLFSFRTRFCTTANFSEVCFIMSKINTETEDSFTVSWLVPQTLITDIMKSVRNLDQSFYQEFKIISLTLDGWWLHMSEAEPEVMWIHMSNAKLVNQFQIIHKQIVHELKLQNTPLDELSQSLMNQHPNLQKDASISLSEAISTFPFPPSGFFLDFDMLSIIIKEFGSDCLRDVMMSYCKFMSGFVKQLSVQQLLDLPPVPTERQLTVQPLQDLDLPPDPTVQQLQDLYLPPDPVKHHESFIKAECRIMEEPSGYTCDKILSIKNSICAEINFCEFMLTMNHVRKPLSDSFFVSWLIPAHFAPDLIESANHMNSEVYVRKSIASLSIGNQWVYNPKLNPFGSKLKEKYRQSQGSPSPVEWIPSPTKKIFRLAMIQRERVQRGHIEDSFVRMTISGRVDDILHAKSPVELEHIFRNTLHGGDIILIEGAPGSGKSTLTVHICQRWGKGELFQQFTVVILVQLRDPAVQRQQTIADLLPVENAEEIAAELTATNGRGVLWVLDGWDELPPHLQQKSIFRHLIEEMLSECSVIVTSRPISSGDLHPVVSSRIEVLGFTPEEQRQYFTECLKGDTKALQALLEKIQENPVVQSICYLPLNATFIIHTFKYRDQSLPNTEYEIYLSVILSCIQRHYDREGRGHDLPRELASLDDLSRSEAVREPFQCLCELAYRGVMKNKLTFSSSDLPQGSNTLSLLQAIESFLQSKKSVFYNFLHLSVQEILSAYYITTNLSDSEQVYQFQQLFNQPRFAAVFQFYAAITKLKSSGLHQVINRIAEAKSKPLLVSLLRCLHEAQDPALCLYVAERLQYRLDFSDTSLSPQDYICVSFFLSSLSSNITVNLRRCCISDLGAKCLSKFLHSDVHHVSKIAIDLYNSSLNQKDALYIARMICFIEHLYLSHNPIGDTGASLISEAVRETATLKTLTLNNCGITSRGAEDISRALAQNSSLEKLDIGDHNLGDDGISHVAEALEQNKQLKELWISDCGMTDKGAASLASALTVNNSLKMLHIGGFKGALTKDGLSTIAHSLANKPLFMKLAIPTIFVSTTTDHLSWEVNEIRKRNGLLPIEIEGECYTINEVMVTK